MEANMPLDWSVSSITLPRSRVGRAAVGTLAQVFACVVLSVTATIYVHHYLSASEDAAREAEVSVESAWNTTIERLGIEPVYPPQEDIAVGDLFAVATADDDREAVNVSARTVLTSSFLSKAVKLGHVPVSDEIDAAYADVPFFGASAAADEAKAPSVAEAAAAVAQTGAPALGTFGRKRWSQLLPRAAFPGLTITYSAKASADLAAPHGASVNAAASSATVRKLHLGTVQTYGLPSIAAIAALRQFCTASDDRRVCDTEAARRSLSAVPGLGERIMVKLRNPNSGKDDYAVTMKIFMISRVYTAREVSEELSLATAQVDRAATGSRDAATAGAPSPASHDADLLPGGALASRTSSGESEVMHEKFPRPIAIGFRSIRYEPPSDADDGTDLRPRTSRVGPSSLPFDPSRCTVFIHAGNVPDPLAHSGIADNLANTLARLGYVVRAPDTMRDVVGGPGVDYFSDADVRCAEHVASTGRAMLNAGAQPSDGEPPLATRRQHDRGVDGHIGVWLF